MSDILDSTDEVEGRLLNLRIQAAQNYSSGLQPIMQCHWCEEPFEPKSQKLFCDSECAMDYDKYQNMHRGKE